MFFFFFFFLITATVFNCASELGIFFCWWRGTEQVIPHALFALHSRKCKQTVHNRCQQKGFFGTQRQTGVSFNVSDNIKLCQGIKVFLGFNVQDEERGSNLAIVQSDSAVLTPVWFLSKSSFAYSESYHSVNNFNYHPYFLYLLQVAADFTAEYSSKNIPFAFKNLGI